MSTELASKMPNYASKPAPLRDIQVASFIGSLKHREQQLRAKRSWTDPRILKFGNALVAEASRYSVPLFAHMYYRDEEEQNRVFNAGHSKAKWGKSPHNFGLACDVIHSTKGWEISRESWEIVGQMGKEIARRQKIAIVWGGDWSFWDPAHWELLTWRHEVANKTPEQYLGQQTGLRQYE